MTKPTIEHLINALRDPAHPLHKQVLHHIEEYTEQVAGQIFDAIETADKEAITSPGFLKCIFPKYSSPDEITEGEEAWLIVPWDKYLSIKDKFLKSKKADIPERMDRRIWRI